MTLKIALTICLLGFSTLLASPLHLNKVKRNVTENQPFLVWNMEKYPNPQHNATSCRRNALSYVCNPDNVIHETEAEKLDRIISKIKTDTICICPNCPEQGGGITIGIAILQNMVNEYHGDTHEEAQKFTDGLLKNWNIGSCEDSMIILLSTQNKELSFGVGNAVNSVLNMDEREEISSAVNVHFEDGLYYQGLESLVQSIHDKLRKIQRSPQMQNETDQGSVGLTVGLVIGFIALAALFAMGIIFLRNKRRLALEDKKPRDGTKSSSIVKSPVVFPDAIYQPCSVEDPAGSYGRRQTSDEELNFDEYATVSKKQMADVHDGVRRELSAVEEEEAEKESLSSSQEQIEFELPVVKNKRLNNESNNQNNA